MNHDKRLSIPGARHHCTLVSTASNSMAYVSCTPHGCVISKPDKQQQIALSLSEWMGLSEIHERVSSFMAGHSQDSTQFWKLPPSGSRDANVEVRVTLNHFEGGCYVNIRVYVDSKPSRQGVTLNNANWTSIQTALGYSAESSLGREVYSRMLRELLAARVKTKCPGCQKGTSDLQPQPHQCVTDPSLVRRCLESLPPVDQFDYTVELAKRAHERRHRLEQPAACYDMCANFLRNAIEEELLILVNQ